MGLPMTRLQRLNSAPSRPSITSMSAVWSARDLCPLELPRRTEPTVRERALPAEDGYLRPDDVKQLFNRLWHSLRNRMDILVEIDMKNVAVPIHFAFGDVLVAMYY